MPKHVFTILVILTRGDYNTIDATTVKRWDNLNAAGLVYDGDDDVNADDISTDGELTRTGERSAVCRYVLETSSMLPTADVMARINQDMHFQPKDGWRMLSSCVAFERCPN